MNAPISDKSAIEFARGFYDAIGDGKNVAFAYREGRRTIKLKRLPDDIKPQLFQKPIESENSPYTVEASTVTPALVVFLVDAGYHMNRSVAGRPAVDLVYQALASLFQHMVFSSTKGRRISSRYQVACYAYSTKTVDLTGGIISVAEAARVGLPDERGNTYDAFMHVEQFLKQNLSDFEHCPAPLVCHITAGEYPGRDPESVVARIKAMRVTDGNVLIENVLIDDEAVLLQTNDPQQWLGILDESQLAKSFARQLFRMSSPLPPSRRKYALELGYYLANGSRMLYPGTQPDMVNLGLVVSASTKSW
jgi:hypothetical protein